MSAWEKRLVEAVAEHSAACAAFQTAVEKYVAGGEDLATENQRRADVATSELIGAAYAVASMLNRAEADNTQRTDTNE